MRFFAHDGKTTHGPAGIDELLKLPGFDGDTLICPVGSNDTADWKPAMAYPPFKKALLDSVAVAPAPPPAAAPSEPLFKPLDSPRSGSMLAPLESSPFAALPAIQPMQPMQPMRPLPPPSAPVAKTVPCPSCKHANLPDARFCNACAARMDGTQTDSRQANLPPKPIEPPKPVEVPKALEMPSVPPPFPPPLDLPKTPEPFEIPKEVRNPFDLPAAAAPAPAPAPVAPPKDPFAHLDPMMTFPAEPEPARRPLQPGKMGQLSSIEEPIEAAASAPSVAPDPVYEAPTVPVWKRPLVVAAFAGVAVLASAAGYVMLKKPAMPVETVAELAPSAPTPVPEPAPAPVVFSPTPETASPSMPAPRAPRVQKSKIVEAAKPDQTAKAKRVRKARPPRAPKAAAVPALAEPGAGDTFIESTAPDQAAKPKAKPKAAKKGAQPAEQDPLLEALLSDATEPGPEAAAEAAPAAPVKKAAPQIGQRPSAAKPSEFSLPGLSRPVSASDRALSKPAAVAEAPVAQLPLPPDTSLGEADKTAPPPGIEDLPAKSAEGDNLALMQVHEQFDFCSQLLTQGAFGDHYDTCLCKEAREAAPYRGRRGYYVTAKKKEAGAGQLETTAKILSSKLDGGVASVTARWKASGSDKGRTSSQTWKLEDGLWCQAP